MIKYNKEWNYRGNHDSYMLYVPNMNKYFMLNASCTFATCLSNFRSLLKFLNKDGEILETDYNKDIIYFYVIDDKYTFFKEMDNKKIQITIS